MNRPRPGWRIGAVLLFLLGLLMSFGAPGVGAQSGFTCADFNNPLAAQILLDADPDQSESLDVDGDGVACNEDEDAVTDKDAYLSTMADEIAVIQASLERFADIMTTWADPMLSERQKQDLNAQTAEVLEFWTAYPDTAAALDAPAAHADIHNAYLDLADMLAEMSMYYEDAAASSPGSQDADNAIDALMDTFVAANGAVDDIQAQLDEADAGDLSADAWENVAAGA